jgi:XTP/dITP diphosphohydrolase
MPQLLLATNNPHKVAEFRMLLAECGWEVVSATDIGLHVTVDESGETYAENAALKALAFARASGLTSLADDSGLEVDALGGRPGIHTARYAGPDAGDEANNDKLLTELARVPPGGRGARYRCAMVFVRHADDPEPVIAEAAWEGFIGLERRGTGGFGYDPLFVVAGGTRTAAELTSVEKNRLSHRGQALRALAERMKGLGW